MITSILSAAHMVYSGELVLFWGIAIYLPFRLLWDNWTIVQSAIWALWRWIKSLFRCSKQFWTLLSLVATILSGIIWCTPGKPTPAELISTSSVYANSTLHITDTISNAVFAPVCPTERYLHQSYEHELRILYEFDLVTSPIGFEPLSIVATSFDLTARRFIKSKNRVREEYEDIRETMIPEWVEAQIQETGNPRDTDIVEGRLGQLRLSLERCLSEYTTLLGGKNNRGLSSHLVHEMEFLQYHIRLRQRNEIRYHSSRKSSSETESEAVTLLFVERSAIVSLETIDSRLRNALDMVKTLKQSLSEHTCFEEPVSILKEDWTRATQGKRKIDKQHLYEIAKVSSNWRPLALGPKTI
ncbi:hypothetical protein KCV07_g3773, partial [Aureobasidium melanogenum]